MDRFAGYELLEPLDEGVFGTYFRAKPPKSLGLEVDEVNLKVLRGADEMAFKRFANEMRILAGVASSHLEEPLDAGSYRGQLFVATRPFNGGTLATSSPPQDALLQVIADAAQGAHALHEAGIAHRDLKPANVAIHDGRGMVRDLGLAQVYGASLTLGVGPIGALDYMYPGLVRGEQPSRRSDIWSLGAVLHHAVSGVSLFPEMPVDSIANCCMHLLDSEPTIRPMTDSRIDQVVRRCTVADEHERFKTALEFSDNVLALRAPR